MAVNYTVVFSQRQRFGNEPDVNYPGVFVGQEKDFPFDCPDVNPNETAVLFFNSYDVEGSNVFQINGVDVYGGLYQGPRGETKDVAGRPGGPTRINIWMTHELLVEPRHQLRATGNVLHVKSRTQSGHDTGDIDDFVLDNMVIMYKTTTASRPLPTVEDRI